MGKKVKILFYLKNLSGGGAERFHTELFKNYDRKKYEYKLLLKDSSLVDYHGDFQQNDFLREKDMQANLRHFSFPEALLQFLCLRLPRSLSTKLLAFYKSKFIRNKLRKIVSTYISDQAEIQRVCDRIMVFFSKHWKSVFLLNRTIINYRPDLLVGSLIETSNALIFLSYLTCPKAYRHTHWVIIEHNNTFKRFEDYYPAFENNHFWNQFTRIIFKNANKVIAVSEGVKKGLVSHYQIEPEKIYVIYNQVDIFSIQKVLPAVIDTPFILSAGRLHSQKRFDAVIRAFAKISDQVNAHLYILGKGNLESDLKRLAQSLDITEKVHFLGFRADLWSYMKASQLFILSSKYEGFGNVIIEAMACGCPVVSYDCDYGPSEIIDHRKNGMLVPDGDEERLADAIVDVLTDDKLHQRLKENGLARAADFSSSDVARKYEKVFSSECYDN